MNLSEKFASEINHFLRIINHEENFTEDNELPKDVKKHSKSLMRVNTSGEVAAQALSLIHI